MEEFYIDTNRLRSHQSIIEEERHLLSSIEAHLRRAMQFSSISEQLPLYRQILSEIEAMRNYLRATEDAMTEIANAFDTASQEVRDTLKEAKANLLSLSD